MKTLRQTLIATAVALTAATTVPLHTAVAQPASYAQNGRPAVTAFDVKSVGEVDAGTELDFTVWGTPGSIASLHIDGAQRSLSLAETSPGRYEGTYTVGRRDRIGPQSKVTANLRRHNLVTTALLSEPLQRGWPSPVAVSTVPSIASVDAANEPGRQYRRTVRYTVKGTPGGQASIQVHGSNPATVMLNEVRPGEYTGIYTLPEGGWMATQRPVAATLRVGDRSTVSTVERLYDDVRIGNNGDRNRWDRDRGYVSCADCGRVEAINRIEVDGNGRVIGTVAGGVLGAVLGSQVGGGSGRTAAGVAGAVGGALLGREIGRRSDHRTQYEVIVRTDDGQRRTVTLDDEPALKVGDAVRITGDNVELRQG